MKSANFHVAVHTRDGCVSHVFVWAYVAKTHLDAGHPPRLTGGVLQRGAVLIWRVGVIPEQRTEAVQDVRPLSHHAQEHRGDAAQEQGKGSQKKNPEPGETAPYHGLFGLNRPHRRLRPQPRVALESSRVVEVAQNGVRGDAYNPEGIQQLGEMLGKQLVAYFPKGGN